MADLFNLPTPKDIDEPKVRNCASCAARFDAAHLDEVPL